LQKPLSRQLEDGGEPGGDQVRIGYLFGMGIDLCPFLAYGQGFSPLVKEVPPPDFQLNGMLMLTGSDAFQTGGFQDLDLDAEIDNMFVDLYSVHYPGFAAA